jgi:hypothetical protein
MLDHDISIQVTSIFWPAQQCFDETLFKLFINHEIMTHDSFVEVIINICMVFGYDLLCDSLEIYRERCCNSQKPSRSNSANEYERPDGREVWNVRIPMDTFFILFFSIYFYV